jgi:putative endonuclease
MRHSYVYIMTGRSDTLYVGVTSGLEKRVLEHKDHVVDGFTKRYNLTSLVYYEVHEDITVAIAREKQIKGWTRAEKIALIESVNPEWRDLSEQWCAGSPRPNPRSGVSPSPDPFANLPQPAGNHGRRSG